MTPEEYISKSRENLDNNLGNEVLQFIIQSLDGMVTIRVGHWVKPYSVNTTKFIVSKLKTIVDTFYKKGVCELIGSASDGDLAPEAVVYTMNEYTKNKYGTPWFHFIDFSHILKALRNAPISTRNLQVPYERID